MTEIHTCSYYCERPECVRRQRDELRDRMESALAQKSTAHPAITFCDNCGCDWLDNGLNPVECPYCKWTALKTEIERLRGALEECHALSVERWLRLLVAEAENERLRKALEEIRSRS